MARVLAIGVATLDVVLTVDGYPAENTKVRVVRRRLARGGNAANTAVVLARLGHRCAWAGTLAADEAATLIREDLGRYGIDLSWARMDESGATPTSYILHNRRNGSRTIVHCRDLREYEAADFQRIDLAAVDWCHFEGRNPDETGAMLERARRAGLPCSLEVEKPRPGIEALLQRADVLLFSREYAAARGHDAAPAFLEAMHQGLAGKRLFCAWGEAGAWAMDETGCLHHAPAPPVQVVETLGAGDTFNAGVIHACLQGYTVAGALHWACRLAGAKCAAEGLEFPLPSP